MKLALFSNEIYANSAPSIVCTIKNKSSLAEAALSKKLIFTFIDICPSAFIPTTGGEGEEGVQSGPDPGPRQSSPTMMLMSAAEPAIQGALFETSFSKDITWWFALTFV